MSEQNKVVQTQGGIGFLGFLALIFITLKLCGVINWSWVWVLAPLWIPIGIVFAVIVGFFAFALLLFGIAGLTEWFHRRKLRNK